jgi:peptidyl-prolyl cis-trans isomerase B (cyclophilin B)
MGRACAVVAIVSLGLNPSTLHGQRQQFYTTTLSAAEMTGKQAVIETSEGQIVIELLPEAAPNHVGYFITRAREGAFDGTTFHRAIPRGIIQGGDPLSKDPAKRALYGTGGLGVLRFEKNPETHKRGAVSAVLRPGQADSGGMQFFISVTDQPALDGQYTVFGRVTEGMDVAEKISESPVDGEGRLTSRVEMTRVTIRDTPPVAAVPFEADTPESLASWSATIETSMGDVTLAFLPEKAPNHVRNFLRLAQAGVYDGMSIDRIVRGFVVQVGYREPRSTPLTEAQKRFVTTLAAEFNDTKHDRGVVSMAHGDDPNSASTSFFICMAPSTSLDGKYTAFGRVAGGLEVLDRIESVPVSGETPVERIEVRRVRVEQGVR